MRERRLFLILGILVALFVCVLWFGVSRFQENADHLRVYFFDVGQGDSIYIRTPDGEDILIDGGPDATVLYELGRVMPFYDFNIDTVILTHPHRDHLAGLLDVFEKYKVETIYHSGASYDSALYEKWLGRASDEGVIKIITEYSKIDLGSGIFFEFLFPSSKNHVSRYSAEVNNTSIVARLIYGESEFLLMGDAEREVEKLLLDSGLDLQADVLKLGHHGSESSSTENFLREVSPKFAIISSGIDNSYGHPHRVIVERLKRLGIDIFRTDKTGTICLESSGGNVFTCDGSLFGFRNFLSYLFDLFAL